MVRTVPTGRGDETVEIPPDRCPVGHRWGPMRVQISYQGCACRGYGERGHRIYRCQVDDCDLVILDPPCLDDPENA